MPIALPSSLRHTQQRQPLQQIQDLYYFHPHYQQRTIIRYIFKASDIKEADTPIST
jgi:hypothetical protein